MDKQNEIRILIKEFYSELLLRDYQIDFIQAESQYAHIGNTTGIHPDSMYFILKMIDYMEIKTIVEIGSGFSTLYLAQLAKKRNFPFLSFEENDNYLKMTRKLLLKYSLDPDIVQLYQHEITLSTSFLQTIDFLFLDCHIGLRQNILRMTKTASIPFVVIDDMEILSEECSQYMKHSNKPLFFVYSGYRSHRAQFISYPREFKRQFVEYLVTFPAF